MLAEGEFALVRQHLEEALTHLDISPMYVTPADNNDLYAMLADVAAQQRDLAALRQYTPLAEETAAHCGHVLYQAMAHRAWGVAHRLVGEYAEAEVRLHQALELFQGLDTRWQIGRTLYELAELAMAHAEAAAARNYFSRALAAFEEMKAGPDAARVRAALKALD